MDVAVAASVKGRARRVQTEAVRREQILSAARSLIAEQGYEKTTTAQIARRAGISEGTIYNYFPSKVAIVTALKDQAMHAIMAGAFGRAVPGTQGGMLVRGMLEGVFAAAHENAELMKAFSLNVELHDLAHHSDWQAGGYEACVEELRQFFAVQQDTGFIPRSVDLAVMSRLILGTVDYALQECVVNGHDAQEQTYIDLMVRMFSRALYIE